MSLGCKEGLGVDVDDFSFEGLSFAESNKEWNRLDTFVSSLEQTLLFTMAAVECVLNVGRLLASWNLELSERLRLKGGINSVERAELGAPFIEQVNQERQQFLEYVRSVISAR